MSWDSFCFEDQVETDVCAVTIEMRVKTTIRKASTCNKVLKCVHPLRLTSCKAAVLS